MNCKNCGIVLMEGSSRCDVCGAEQDTLYSEQGQMSQGADTNQDTAMYQGADMNQEADMSEKNSQTEVKSNPITGIVGAFLGAAIGGASILLFSQMGYIASVSGLILAVCTLKGYELLGKKLDKIGIFICAILMLVTPYIADRIDWARMLVQEFGDQTTFAQAFQVFPQLLAEGIITMQSYLINLGMLYLFVIIGAYSTLKNNLK